MPALTTLHQVEDWLANCTNHERQGAGKHRADGFSLNPCRELLEQLGNPHLRGSTIHIAGSDGKGSIAAMLTNLALAAEHRTGTFTSPHLVNVRERIAINGRPVDEEQFLTAASLLHETHAAMVVAGRTPCTFFELTAALAWLVFRQAGVERIVLETGLGGRLDATNLCQPACCVITPIELEHMDWLGDTLIAIAREKLGIIKHTIPWVAAPQHPDLHDLFVEYARNLDAPVTCIPAENPTIHEKLPTGTRFSCQEGEILHENLFLALPGWHQLTNARTAIHAGKIWLGMTSPDDWRRIVRLGLSRTRWPARCQYIPPDAGGPAVIDCAHTSQALHALAATLQDWYPEQPRRVIICACMRDKNPLAGLAKVARPGDIVITTQVDNPRCLPAQELAAKLVPGLPGRSVMPAADLSSALKMYPRSTPGNLTIVTGSCYLAGAYLEQLSFPISLSEQGDIENGC